MGYEKPRLYLAAITSSVSGIGGSCVISGLSLSLFPPTPGAKAKRQEKSNPFVGKLSTFREPQSGSVETIAPDSGIALVLSRLNLHHGSRAPYIDLKVHTKNSVELRQVCVVFYSEAKDILKTQNGKQHFCLIWEVKRGLAFGNVICVEV